ncbi:MAG: NifU family protein [Planctomycetota bacterium]
MTVTEPSSDVGTGTDPKLEDLAARVDEALRQANDQPVGAARRATALREAVEAFHREGISRILRTVAEHPAGDEILGRLSKDAFAQTLLGMHGLVRPGIDARVLDGLVDARPWLREHGGDVTFVERVGDVVRVRLTGSCTDCTLAPLTLREAVFNAVKRKAPEITRIELAEPEAPPPKKITIEHPGEGWEPGPSLEELPEECTVRFDASEKSLLIHRRGDVIRAWENSCPHRGFALDGALAGGGECDGEIECPWHGWRFDLGSGDCVHLGDARLVPVPLLVRGGVVWVRP